MNCYERICFCSFWKECAKGDKCFRALTDEVHDKAFKMKLPVAGYVNKPECFTEMITNIDTMLP